MYKVHATNTTYSSNENIAPRYGWNKYDDTWTNSITLYTINFRQKMETLLQISDKIARNRNFGIVPIDFPFTKISCYEQFNKTEQPFEPNNPCLLDTTKHSITYLWFINGNK